MKSLTSTTRNNNLKQKIKSSCCYSYTRVTYINDSGTEVEFYDSSYPIKITKRGEPPRYANTAWVPATKECNFGVINKGGIYSPKNTDSASYDILKRDRVFKFYDGKWVSPVYSTTETTCDLGDATMLYIRALTDSAGDETALVLDVDNSGGNTVNHFEDIFILLGAHAYGSDEYAPDGYAVFTEDLSRSKIGKLTKLSITANSALIRVYYRMSDSLSSCTINNRTSAWHYLGMTENGEKDFTVDVVHSRYLQIALLWDTADWDSGAQITSVQYTLTQYVEWVLLGTFYLDDPDFQDKQSPGIPTVNVSGRCAYKRALETQINTKNLGNGGAGTQIDDLIKDICDEADISYTASSIADLSAYGNRNLTGGYDDTVTIDTIFNDIMDIIGNTYRMYISDDNYMYVTARPTAFSADWVQNFKRYLTAKQKEVSEKQLQSIRFATSQEILNKTEILGTGFINVAGSHDITWAGNAQAKYPVVTYGSNNGNGLVTAIEMYNEKVTITVTGTVVDVDVVIWGCFYKSDEPTYMGEAVNLTNILAKDGFRRAEINPLIISDTEAKNIAEARITEFGDPAYNVEIQDSFLNPLIEINDMNLVFSEDFFEDTLYEVIGIDYNINSETNKTASYFLLDTGLNYSDEYGLVWDDGLYDGTAIQWDIGIPWDATHRIGATKSEILATNPKVYNVDCT